MVNKGILVKKNRFLYWKQSSFLLANRFPDKNIATLVTYVPVLVAEQLFRVIFDGFCSNWFQLVSAQLLNSQIFNPKKILLLSSSRFLDQTFLLPEIWWCLPEVLNRFEKKVILKLDDGNMPRFVQHWIFLQKLQLWRLMVYFLRKWAYMMYTLKSSYDLHNYFRFSSIIFNIIIKLRKWAMP